MASIIWLPYATVGYREPSPGGGTTARYWAILVTASGGGNRWGTREVEFRDGLDVDLTGSGTAFGPDGVGSADVANAFDNDDGTVYSVAPTSFPLPQRFYYDFGSDVEVASMTIRAFAPGSSPSYSRRIVSGEIQNSGDASSWTTIQTFSGLAYGGDPGNSTEIITW